MDRKGSCATLLRLPLAQINKRKIADVDENASDGYDQPGRLVIDTSNNCSENMAANDRSEHWMKTVSGRKGDQQEQLCQIDLGNKGLMLIHVRTYDRRDDGTLFPTKKGMALNLEKWKKLQYCFLENVDSAVGQYQDSKPVDLFIHLGGNYHVSVKNGYPLVNIGGWFVPEGLETLTPTKAGMALTFLRWEKLKSAMLLVEELLNGELDNVNFCEESHQNQVGALACSNFNPNDFMNH